MIPAGITTALVHLDAPISFTGGVGRIHATITPSVPLVWAATGTPVGNFMDNVALSPGVALEVELPHTDQDGFLDGNGNTITGWYYTITITFERGGQKIPFPARDFQILTGQSEVDLALIPSGSASPVPSVAPVLPVTSIAGYTGEITGAELDTLLNSSSAVGGKVTKGSLVMNLRDQAGVVGDGAADDTAAIQAAASSAAALGARVFGRGTFKVSGTIAITSDADLTGATFNYTGSGVAVRVGVTAGFISRKEVKLPHIIHTAKTVNGWAQVAGSTGVEISNLYTGSVHVPHVKNFETGLRIKGYGQGVSYVNLHLGHLDNNKVNMQFSADATGWANQNSIFGGRMSHNSNEGTVTAGTRNVLMDTTAYRINNNNFYSTSFESPNTVEYHLDCAGVDNFFWGCRWENTGTGARVIWRAGSQGNAIKGGYESWALVETSEGVTANEVSSRAGSRLMGTGLAGSILNLQNMFSSSSSAVRIFEPSIAQPDTGGTSWSWNLSAQKMLGKRSGDAFERINVDAVNGRIYVGQGTAASTRYFGSYSTFMGFEGSDVGFPTDNTYDFGRASQRPRYIRAGTAIQPGSFTTATRPAAATAGAGSIIHDSDLKKNIASDGTAWKVPVMQGDTYTTDLELTDATKGIVLKSPNGTRYRLTVGDDGALTTTAL